MLTIWKNFVAGREKFAIAFMIVFSALGFTRDPWWVGGPLYVLVFVFFVPWAFYRIDLAVKRNQD